MVALPPPRPTSTPARRHHHNLAVSVPGRHHHLHVTRCFPDQLPKPEPTNPPNPLLSLLMAVPDWADAVSERRISDPRPLYTHKQWREHRSSLRHLRRKAWMRVLAGAAELSGMVMHRGGDERADEELGRSALLNYILAFPVALKCHITSNSDIRRDLQGLLTEDDLNVIMSSKHRPRCVIEFISQSVQMLDFEEHRRSVMESKLSYFLEGICVCERIIGITVPLSYTRLTSRFLVLWRVTLPIILWTECKWIVVLATFVSAASLFCIEECGGINKWICVFFV
uniref:Uncharacterized protein n=4 Tax=Avena sativa TaxID=4498 RepID=A0ACD5VPV8_AVESA